MRNTRYVESRMSKTHTVSFVLNNRPVTIDADPATSLLDVLRGELGLTGTKQGCDHEGECGACTVLLDGRAVRSCLTPVGRVAGRRVLTVEGLGHPDDLHPLQVAFIETGAVQCGYCTPGMLLAAKALLDGEPNLTREQIYEALEGNLCRCTGYTRIVMAVEIAAVRMRGEQAPRLPKSSQTSEVFSRLPIGGDVLRTDSIDKVTGRARYVEDMAMPGMLHGKVVRSPHHHARVLSLNVERAVRLPGVVCVLTAADVPGENGLGDYSRDEPVLPAVGDTVRMLGAPVALIVATSSEQAQAGVEAIEVAYQPLPHTFDAQESLEEGAFPIYEGGNVLETDRVAHGDLEAAFDASEVILETSYRTAFQEHAALEREAVLGYLDEAGRVTVVAGTHQPHWAQGYIASALALDPAQVRVIVPPTGGSFGGRQDPWPLVATALMTYSVRGPVRLVYSRQESFAASPKRHPYRLDYRVGARDGRLTGVRVRIKANTGGYDAHGQYIPNYAVMASGGPYRWQAVDAQAWSVYTNGPKAGQFRGFGTPQSIFALECTLNELAQKLGQDPLEFRLRNAVDQPSVSFLGYPVAESMGYTEVLEAIRPRYLAFQEAAAAFNASTRQGDAGSSPPLRKGVGLAGMWYRFGKSGSLRVEAHAELADDGHLIVYCSAPDYGQGTNTVMSQLAAEALGVSRERIELVNADTARTPDSGIQGASRATYWVGNAVCNAVQNLKLGIQATAAELLDCPPADLTLVDGRVASRSEPAKSISLASVAQEFDNLGRSRKALGTFDLSPLFPEETRPEYVPLFVTGAHLAEVVVNLHTGEVRVTRVVAAHDVGRAVNPLDAKGQIEGAVLMGLGSALLEEFIPGHSRGFGDYYLPTVKSMPEIEVMLVEVPSFYGPHGAKGLGEAATLPSTPAIINAVSRAIGTRIREIPATPERVLQAIRSR
jgi:CO/xanthine dehydrogenase Mo-binding subunit/aerobic-type carbon monoxide dehydrogenase small subunit (CoxS/CutS family)